MPKKLLVVVVLFFSLPTQSQIIDSLKMTIGTQFNAGSAGYQPLWMMANHFGTISDKGSDLTSNITVLGKTALFSSEELGQDLLVHKKEFFINYGLSVYNNNHLKHNFIEQGYLGLLYRKWTIRIGRFEEITGDFDPDLSSGSLGISGNSLPIPKISAALLDYVDVPFTNGWFQIKGSFAHGWFGNDRYLKNAYYHEKSFYGRLGPGKLKLYGGLQHFAEWGGKRGDFQLDRSWKGFLNVVFVRQADDGSVGTAINGLLPSRAGDQRGLLEAGFYLDENNFGLHAYAQMPFESGEEISPQNRSTLSGLVWSNKDSSAKVSKILIEILYTKDQAKFVFPGQRQSLYNNGYYKTGWDYNERIIGTPLFIDRERANKYFPTVPLIDWNAPNNKVPGNDNILDNRIFAINVGAVIKLNDDMLWKTLMTYTTNYGAISKLSESLFGPYKSQFYSYQKIIYKPSASSFEWRFELGVDLGQLSTNIGASIGCIYSLMR